MGSERKQRAKRECARGTAVFTQQGERDKNEMFVVKKCCDYMLRLMPKQASLSEEAIAFVCWILGDDMTQIGDFVLSRSTRGTLKKRGELLSAGQISVPLYADTIYKILNDDSSRMIPADFICFVTDLLHDTRNRIAGNTDSDLEKSLAHIRRVFDLTDLEAEVCLIGFIVEAYDALDTYLNDHLKVRNFQGKEYLSTILGVTRNEINSALWKTLEPAGLIEMERHGFGSPSFCIAGEMRDFFDKHSGNILEDKNLKRIKKGTAPPLQDHFVPEADIHHVLALLAGKTESATHILLYGPPGTGKTSFAYGLAKKLADPVYEITQQKTEENESKKRRLVLNACVSSMNRGRGAIFIMDEADNVLNTEDAWWRRGETQDKGWLNSLLDRPGLRIIWIVNHIQGMEASVLRRFAFSLHFKPFNRQQRERLWATIVRRHRCKRFFADDDLRYLAQAYQVSAGVMDLAVKKAREAGHNSRETMQRAVWQGVESHQILVNGGYKKDDPDGLEESYSPDGLNISADIQQVLFQAEQFDRYLKDTPEGGSRYGFNLLLYGPPGSGKSEFARFLARHLGRELLVRRLSDLLDPYVGMTERYIREAFDRAAHDGAVLLIDEADAVLFPREGAMRSWEISHTAEMLTAMERFRGILIATTNRLIGVDSAAIRRFNHKIGFDYLTPEGNRLFYERMLGAIAVNAPNTEAAGILKRLERLTPGDFKIVRDRFVFYPKDKVTAAMLVEALKQEAEIKQQQSGNTKIGF